jgi:DNA-binding MarR family transcriptional regulator
MSTTTPPERTLGFVLHDVARFLRRRFEQRAREADLGLTRAQWSVLAHLARQEGINQAALAQIMEIEPITLVRLLDRLQAAGLVERRPDPADRRARVLYLTPAARPLLERIWALAAAVREEAMAGLPDAERDQLIGMLLKIKGNLTERIVDAADDEPSRRAEASRG